MGYGAPLQGRQRLLRRAVLKWLADHREPSRKIGLTLTADMTAGLRAACAAVQDGDATGKATRRALALPIFPGISPKQQRQVVGAVQQFYAGTPG